jgi:hypothetical protein
MQAARLTPTQLEVLRLIAENRALGDYVPRYRPGARRGRGAFPVTIAERAAVQLVRKGLVELGPSANGYVLTRAGAGALGRGAVEEPSAEWGSGRSYVGTAVEQVDLERPLWRTRIGRFGGDALLLTVHGVRATRGYMGPSAGTYHDFVWVLWLKARTRSEPFVIGAGEFSTRTGAPTTHTAGMIEGWQGKRLYPRVLNALAATYGRICSEPVVHLTASAQRAWSAAGGEQIEHRGDVVWCLNRLEAVLAAHPLE